MHVRTRFAPSPTGYLHIGGVRTALFNWLYARRFGGQFILRIEDTDRERSSEASIDAILEGMQWLQLDYDEGPYYQTKRFDRYKEVINQLLDEGMAYRCYCTREELQQLREQQLREKQKPRYDGRYRDYEGPPREGVDPVIRFKNPLSGEVKIKDRVRGNVVVKNSELDDLVIARADGTPTYNLTVVVDDLDMEITHVIRGDDHLNNTPRQINLIRALGQEPPVYAHVPMILGSDGKRLSKRHGAVSVTAYRDLGILPDALLNYLVRLGWAHGDQEIFTRREMVDLFDLEGVNKSASTFDDEKLLWVNQHYIKATPVDHLVQLAMPLFKQRFDTVDPVRLAQVIELQKDRVRSLAELVEQSAYFFEDFAEYDDKAVKKSFKEASLQPLQDMLNHLQGLSDWSAPAIDALLSDYLSESALNMGKVAQPIRVAVTGSSMSPSIGPTMQVLGKEKVVERLTKAVDFIQSRLESNVRDKA